MCGRAGCRAGGTVDHFADCPVGAPAVADWRVGTEAAPCVGAAGAFRAVAVDPEDVGPVARWSERAACAAAAARRLAGPEACRAPWPADASSRPRPSS